MNPKQLLTKFYAAFSGKAKPASALDEYMTDEELKTHIAFFESAFPNYELEIEDLLEEGNQVAVRARIKAVHAGDLNGIPPTYKKVDLPFLGIYKIENDKITQHWLGADQLALLSQLGVVPEMAH